MTQKLKTNNQKLYKSCSVVVSSFDGFEDVWEAFFALFFRYWPDCPFDVYLITNKKSFIDGRIKVIKVGKDKGWASNLKSALIKIKTPFVLYMQEDYFLQEKINTKAVVGCLEVIKKEKADCVRLMPVPGANEKWKNYKKIGLISQDADYRISLQAAIWKKNSLKKILVEGETGWDAEVTGSKDERTRKMLFLSVLRSDKFRPPLPYLCTAIVKGRWKPEALDLIKKEGLKIDVSQRGIWRQKKGLKKIIDQIYWNAKKFLNSF